jgi:hypothetical protein
LHKARRAEQRKREDKQALGDAHGTCVVKGWLFIHGYPL